MFLVRREESRSFDVFFFSVVFFGVWKKEKMCREAGQKANFRKKCGLSDLGGVLGAIYSSDTNFEAAALQGLLASKFL